MRFIGVLFLLTAALFFFLSTTVQAKVRVGVFECPPFVISNGDGTYSGLSMLLWQRIAEENKLDYDVTSYDINGLLQGVADGSINVGVSCISITPAREVSVDFSHSFYETHLAIAVKKQGVLTFLKNLLTNMELFTYFLIFIAIASFIGLLFFLFEHKSNEKFYSSRSKGGTVLEIVMLGLVSIIKGPFSYHLFQTLPARVLAVVLTISSTFFIAGITAILASSLTLKSLDTDIKTPDDLRSIKVGAIAASVSSELMTNGGIIHQTFKDVHEMLAALDKEEVEAIMTDDAVLKYQLKKEREQGNYHDLTVLPYQFAKQNYGFVLPEDNPNEELLNQALLEVRKSDEWKQVLTKYLEGI